MSCFLSQFWQSLSLKWIFCPLTFNVIINAIDFAFTILFLFLSLLLFFLIFIGLFEIFLSWFFFLVSLPLFSVVVDDIVWLVIFLIRIKLHYFLNWSFSFITDIVFGLNCFELASYMLTQDYPEMLEGRICVFLFCLFSFWDHASLAKDCDFCAWWSDSTDCKRQHSCLAHLPSSTSSLYPETGNSFHSFSSSRIHCFSLLSSAFSCHISPFISCYSADRPVLVDPLISLFFFFFFCLCQALCLGFFPAAMGSPRVGLDWSNLACTYYYWAT